MDVHRDGVGLGRLLQAEVSGYPTHQHAQQYKDCHLRKVNLKHSFDITKALKAHLENVFEEEGVIITGLDAVRAVVHLWHFFPSFCLDC